MSNSKRILVVDDDAFSRRRLCDVLAGNSSSSNQYQVYEAVDGGDALEKVAMHRPDLVLLDLFLPSRSGIEILLQLKQRNPGLPIVVVSSLDMTSVVETAMRAGANSFISKPIDSREVLSRVSVALQG